MSEVSTRVTVVMTLQKMNLAVKRIIQKFDISHSNLVKWCNRTVLEIHSKTALIAAFC